MKNRAIKAKNHAVRVQKRAEKNKIRRNQMLKILRANVKKKDDKLQWNSAEIVNQFLNNQQNISDFSNEAIDVTDQSKEIVVQNSESNIQDHISDDNID